MSLLGGIPLVDADGVDPDPVPPRYVPKQAIQRLEHMFGDGEAGHVGARVPAEHGPRRDWQSPRIR